MGDIFLKVLNMSITASWLILAVLTFRLLFRKVPKWIHCLLWGVVAIRLVCPFSLESTFGLLKSTEPIKTSMVAEGTAQAYIPYIDSEWSVIEDTINPMLEESFAYEEVRSIAPLQAATYIAGMVWLIGMVVLLAGAFISLYRLHILVRPAIPYRDHIMICDEVKSPFILGILRPQIYLSSGLSEQKIAYIVAHEQAHVKRRDHIWKPLGYLVLCVHWFNPLCWVAYRLLCKDMELACDERVVKHMDIQERKEYSRTLVSCANQRKLVMACPLAFGEVGVKTRVKTILNYKKPAFWIVLASILVCVIVAVCFLTTAPKEEDEMIGTDETIGMDEWIKETIHVEKYDVTHDGIPDTIVTSLWHDGLCLKPEMSLQEKIQKWLWVGEVLVEVYDGEADSDDRKEENLIWSHGYSAVHAGNGQISIIQVDDKDYLLSSSLYVGQGTAAFDYEVFSLNQSGEKNMIEDQFVEFSIEGDYFPLEFTTFRESLEQYTQNGILLVACDISNEEQFVRTQENAYVPQDYYKNAFDVIGHMKAVTEETWSKEDIITMYEKIAEKEWAYIDCVVMPDGASDRVGAVLFHDAKDGTNKVSFFDANGFCQSAGTYAALAEDPKFTYIGDGTVAFQVKHEDGGSHNYKLTISVDGDQVHFVAEED